MGFLSASANLGSIGSTARWAIKMYQEIKSQNSKLSSDKIFLKMITARLASSPSEGRYNSHLLQHAEKAPGLAGLVIEILCAESELNANSGENINEMIVPLFEKLEETDLSQEEKYGVIKNKHSRENPVRWVTHTLYFMRRVLDGRKES